MTLHDWQDGNIPLTKNFLKNDFDRIKEMGANTIRRYNKSVYDKNIFDAANHHNLKVIYDAAHAFGVTYKGNSIFDYGDLSTCSFHATKIFHTGEGGAMFCNDKDLYSSSLKLPAFMVRVRYSHHTYLLNL